MEFGNSYIFMWRGDFDTGNSFVKQITDMRLNLENTQPLMEQIGSLVGAALRRNYENSGTKIGTGRAIGALSEKGASGNVYEVTNKSVRWSFNANTVPELAIIIDGRTTVFPVKRKALRWWSNGQWVFAKRSRAVAGKDLYYLTTADEQAITALIDNYVTGGE